MNELKEMVEGRSGSAITEMLDQAPKLVENVLPVPEELPEFSFKSLFSGSAPKPVGQVKEDKVEQEPEQEYIPMTPAEIELKAESKSEMWAAILAMMFDVLNRVIAIQSLEKGDKELVKTFEEETRILGHVPPYDIYHPYFLARQRWDEFTKATKEDSEVNTLNAYQKGLLKRAIKADIEKKDRDKQMKAPTITEAIMEIAIAKATPQAVLLFTTKFSGLSSKLR